MKRLISILAILSLLFVMVSCASNLSYGETMSTETDTEESLKTTHPFDTSWWREDFSEVEWVSEVDSFDTEVTETTEYYESDPCLCRQKHTYAFVVLIDIEYIESELDGDYQKHIDALFNLDLVELYAPLVFEQYPYSAYHVTTSEASLDQYITLISGLASQRLVRGFDVSPETEPFNEKSNCSADGCCLLDRKQKYDIGFYVSEEYIIKKAEELGIYPDEFDYEPIIGPIVNYEVVESYKPFYIWEEFPAIHFRLITTQITFEQYILLHASISAQKMVDGMCSYLKAEFPHHPLKQYRKSYSNKNEEELEISTPIRDCDPCCDGCYEKGNHRFDLEIRITKDHLKDHYYNAISAFEKTILGFFMIDEIELVLERDTSYLLHVTTDEITIDYFVLIMSNLSNENITVSIR